MPDKQPTAEERADRLTSGWALTGAHAQSPFVLQSVREEIRAAEEAAEQRCIEEMCPDRCAKGSDLYRGPDCGRWGHTWGQHWKPCPADPLHEARQAGPIHEMRERRKKG